MIDSSHVNVSCHTRGVVKSVICLTFVMYTVSQKKAPTLKRYMV